MANALIAAMRPTAMFMCPSDRTASWERPTTAYTLMSDCSGTSVSVVSMNAGRSAVKSATRAISRMSRPMRGLAQSGIIDVLRGSGEPAAGASDGDVVCVLTGLSGRRSRHGPTRCRAPES